MWHVFDRSALVLGTAFIVLLSLLPGCAKPVSPQSASATKVVATRPVVMSIIEWDEYIGRIDPVEEVEVRARVSGHLESTHFQEGQIVQKGELLMVLDQRPYKIALEQAEADLSGAEAKHQEAVASLQQAEADLKAVESQRELAAANLERAKQLVAKNALSKEEHDTRESALKQIVAGFDLRVARIASARAAITTALSEIAAAKSRLKTAQLNLDYTEVRAPVTGRVSNRVVTDGNLISGGTDQAALLTTIVSLDPIHVYFDADERSFLKYVRLTEAGKLEDLRDKKVPVLVGLADNKESYPHQGHMDFLDNRLNRGTATMRGRAILPNPDLVLTPGLFAKVRVPGSGRYDAVLIPDLAIGTDQSEKFVFVIDKNNTVQRQKIEIGPKVHGLRVVRQGLDGSEQIVMRGLQRVRSGTVVDASTEPTVTMDDGLPDVAKPLPEQDWIPSYASGSNVTFNNSKPLMNGQSRN